MKSPITMRLSLISAAIGLLSSFGVHAQSANARAAATPESAVAANVMPGVTAPYAAPANVFVPESSRRNPTDAGVRAHTNYVMRAPGGIQPRTLSDLVGSPGTELEFAL